MQISQRVGTLPGPSLLYRTIKVLTAATGRDRPLSLGFAQPQQVEAFQGGFDKEAFRELGPLVFAILLESLC